MSLSKSSSKTRNPKFQILNPEPHLEHAHELVEEFFEDPTRGPGLNSTFVILCETRKLLHSATRLQWGFRSTSQTRECLSSSGNATFTCECYTLADCAGRAELSPCHLWQRGETG